MTINTAIQQAADGLRNALKGDPEATRLLKASAASSPLVRLAARKELARAFPGVAKALHKAEMRIAKEAGLSSPLVDLAKSRSSALLLRRHAIGEAS